MGPPNTWTAPRNPKNTLSPGDEQPRHLEHPLPPGEDVVEGVPEVRRTLRELDSYLGHVLIPALHDLVPKLRPDPAARQRFLHPPLVVGDDVRDQRARDPLRPRPGIAGPEYGRPGRSCRHGCSTGRRRG